MYVLVRSRDRVPDPGFFARSKGTATQVNDARLEIDIATAPAFLASIREMIDWADNRAVVIDCSAITFMDSAAYHVLLAAHEYATEQDHVLVIRGLNPNCARLISLCDPDGVLTISP